MEGVKNALINQLRVEQLTKLSIEEKGHVVMKLKDKYKLSYRKLQILTGINHSTLQDWVSGRQTRQNANEGTGTHVTIDMMIRKLDGYKPRLEEFGKLEKLKLIIERILEAPTKGYD